MIPLWASDAAIGLSSVAISTGLCIAFRSSEIRLARFCFALFGLFIILCGFGHLRHSWLEYRGVCNPYDMLMLWINGATALISAGTAFAILPRLRLYISVIELPIRIAHLETKLAAKESDVLPDRHKG